MPISSNKNNNTTFGGLNADVKVYADLDAGTVIFEGSKVNVKPVPLNSLEAIAGSRNATNFPRIKVRRTDITSDNGSDWTIFHNRASWLFYDKDGNRISTDTDGPTQLQAVLDYLNGEFAKTQQAEIDGSAFIEYDIYADTSYAGGDSDGTALKPFTSVQAAVDAAVTGDQIFLKGDFHVTSEVLLPDNKNLHFFGTDITQVCYASYDSTNGKLINQPNAGSTAKYSFDGIRFLNAGDYAVNIASALDVSIKNCEFIRNGWSGNRLSTVLAGTDTWANGGTLGYDSTQADLQSFWASTETSDGGALMIASVPVFNLTDSTFNNNLRGARIQDCGIGGAGIIARNRTYNNIETGIHLAASGSGETAASGDGCENFTVYNNFSANNSSNGVKVTGGSNNIISLNRVEGNWNAGILLKNVSDTRARDMDLDNNNRSEFNGIGNVGDAKASIQIDGAYMRSSATFLAEVLDTTVHNTGLGSSTTRNGLLIGSTVGTIDGAIINIDDVGFVSQDYAINLSEVDVTNIQLALGDCRYQEVVQTAVLSPSAGNYSELPYSNHVTSTVQVDVVVDVLKQMISLTEGVGGNVINTYKINELQAVVRGTGVDIIQSQSDKIQLRGCTLNNTFINGATAGNTLNAITNNLNAAFQMDLTQYKDFLTSEVGVNAGETLPAQTNNWFISYGTRATEQVTVPTIVASLEDQQPFYNGNFLEKGHEYTWTHDDSGYYLLGIYTGAESTSNETDITSGANWSHVFRFATSGSNRVSETSVGVDVATRYASGYAITNNTVFALRYGNDNHLYLLDISGGGEVVIGRSNTTLVGDSVTIFFGGENQPNAKFPVMQERTERWTFVHDFDNSESNEWADGIETDSVLRSNLTFSPGEKVTINLNYFGRSESIGFGYGAASSGLNNAYNQISQRLFYNTHEVLKGGDTIAATGGDWTWNTSATHSYNPNGNGSDVGYANGGTGNNLGLISWRYKSDNTLEMWHETNNELMATLTAPLDGGSYNVYFGVNEAHPVSRIPTLQKYDMSASEEGANIGVWYYIESPDGVYTYPLFAAASEANYIDTVEGGAGNSQGYTFPDDPTSTTWYGPDTNIVTNGSLAPSHGVWGGSTNVLWNEIATNADSTAAPTPFVDAQVTLDELTALNYQIHPTGATYTTTIQSAPAWITQASDNANITGTAPNVAGDNVNFPSDSYTLTVVRTNSYGSSTGTLTVVVSNLTAPASLPGTLHAGSVIASSATNSAGKIYLQVTGGHLVYDIDTLEDGDKIEWYHQDGTYGFGIAASGVDKTADMLDSTVDNSGLWDLLAPITGTPTNTHGQNFGENFPGSQPGLVPLGWDDNTNPQQIPTRPIYAASDVWKLYNNAGTIELSLNGTLFRSSSSTHTDPLITFVVNEQSGSGGSVVFGEMPTFTHTANAAAAPTGFTLTHGSMDTSSLLNADSVVTLDNLSLSPGQRFIVDRSWTDTNVLPHIDGASGEDNKVIIGIPKPSATWNSVDLDDFYSLFRVENQSTNLTQYRKQHNGPSPQDTSINRASDTDSDIHFAIEFTREGDLVTMWSPDSNPSLTTEPITGTIGHVQTWSSADSTVGTAALDLAVGTKASETRVNLSESGLSVITAPSKANEFDVTEDTSNAPLFNGDPASNITLAAGSTYKFWLHSTSIESTDALGICLVSNNSDYTTGVTVVGTPGSFGSYVEFAIPADVPPVKFKWTSGGVAYYSTPTISGSTYSVSVTGITLEGPATNQTDTNLFDAGDHGWVSINEPLGAGERIVFSGAFLSDVADAMGDNTIISFGVKDTSWANTISSTAPSGFEGGMRISIYRVSATNFQLYGYNGDTSTSTTTLGGGTLYDSSQFLNYNAFLEVTNSGNNVRVGYALTSTSNASTVAYANFDSTTKIQSGDQGYGISTVDVMVQGYAVSGTDTTDANDIDWTALSEIAIPAPAPNSTDWDKAIDFDGSNDHMKYTENRAKNIPTLRDTSGIAPSTSVTAGNTAASGQPWAISCTFNSASNVNGHLWSTCAGSGSNDPAAKVLVNTSGRLIFRYGTGSNYVKWTSSNNRVATSTWYTLYIEYNGGSTGAASGSVTDYYSRFRIKMVDHVTGVVTDIEPTGSWSNSNYGYSGDITGNIFCGSWHDTTALFQGKIAALCVTTLRCNVALPTDAEIAELGRDPIDWVTIYKAGNNWRRCNYTNDTPGFSTGTDAATGGLATKIWLMGDGTSDAFSNIRSQIVDSSSAQGLDMQNMVAADIETVTINGLT